MSGITNSRKRRTPDKNQNIRQNLLDTGYRMICEEGIENVGVRDISEAAGVTTGTFYYYFSSKEDLLCCYANERHEFANEFDPKNDACAYDNIMEYFLKAVSKVITTDGCEVAIHVLSQKKTNKTLFANVLSMVRDGMDSGEFVTDKKSAEDLTTFILECYRGAVFAWFRKDGEVDFDALLKDHVGIALHYFLA